MRNIVLMGVLYIRVMWNRDFYKHTANEMFFDLDWNKMTFHYTQSGFDYVIECTENLDETIRVAGISCKEFKYVKVDLYIINNNVNFGEMAFSLANDTGEWNPSEAIYTLGKFLDLNA